MMNPGGNLSSRNAFRSPAGSATPEAARGPAGHWRPGPAPLAVGCLALVLIGVGGRRWLRRAVTHPIILVRRAAAALQVTAPHSGEDCSTWDETIRIIKPAPFTMQERHWRSGDRMRLSRTFSGVRQEFYSDSAGGWVESDGNVNDMSRLDWNLARAPLRFQSLLIAAAQRRTPVRSLGWRRLQDGSNCEAVALNEPGAPPLDYYFSPGQMLPAAYGLDQEDWGRNASYLYRIHSYRRCGGTLIPGDISEYQNNVLESQIHVTDCRPDAVIPSSLFTRPESAAGTGAATVPIKLFRLAPLVRASINGGPPHWFVIDTGAGISSLTPTVAAQAGLKPEGGFGTTHWLAAREVSLGHVRSLSIGGASVSNLLVAMDPGFRELPGVDDFGGLLGYNFLARFDVTLDYPGKRLSLRPLANVHSIGPSIPFQVDRGQIQVTAAAAEKKFPLALDTGTNATFLPPALAQALPLYNFQKAGYTIGAAQQKVNEYTGSLSSLDVGGHVLNDIPIRYMDPATAGQGRLSPLGGILGGTYLSHFVVTINYPAQRLTLTKAHPAIDTPGPP